MNADLTATEAELLAAAQALYSFGALYLEFSTEVECRLSPSGGMWGVWTPADESTDYPGEVIGAGVTKSEAIADAMAVLRQWEAP